jgi:hypothetical protein
LYNDAQHQGPDSGGDRGYSPNKANWHAYQAGPNVVCPAEVQCTYSEMVDRMSRFTYPGQNPADPARDSNIYTVHDVWVGFRAGDVITEFFNGGATVRNTTLPGHILYDGQIIRNVSQGADGSWSVTTWGVGNNISPVAAWLNVRGGKATFNTVDAQMLDYTVKHHGEFRE